MMELLHFYLISLSIPSQDCSMTLSFSFLSFPPEADAPSSTTKLYDQEFCHVFHTHPHLHPQQIRGFDNLNNSFSSLSSVVSVHYNKIPFIRILFYSIYYFCL